MQYNPLGKTGIDVSIISFGTVALGLPYGLTSNSAENMLPADQAVKLLRDALDHGINFFDTAPAYGTSEELLGDAFADRRDRVVISTKCPHTLFDQDNKLLPTDQLENIIRQSVQNSLKALKTDYIDVFLAHRATDEILASDDFLRIFAQLKNDGLVRAIGISTYGPKHTEQAISCGHWDVVQLAFNLMDQTNAPALKLAQQRQVGVMVRSVLFKGILTDKGAQLSPPLKAVQDWREKYLDLLCDQAPTLAQLATKFVMGQPGVSSTLIGLDRPEYLDQALALMETGMLDEETIKAANKLPYPDPDFLDLPAWDRKGWL
ncbi:MAG: aldo/keto reductase [Sedimentisphaerales bacterium]|nr:aldo/keto reductase [Sedimentisphaerales bacterium]